MAGEGVKLVERLRLGEKPEPVDWQLAGAILVMRDAAAAFMAAANDVVDDRDRASNNLRFTVRARLLAGASERLEEAASAVLDMLDGYFAVRAEDDGEDDAADQPAEDAAAKEAPAESVATELSAVLRAGGVSVEDADALGWTGETMRLDAVWLGTEVASFLSDAPDEERSLDFCGEVETRSAVTNFMVDAHGGELRFSAALRAALDRAVAEG